MIEKSRLEGLIKQGATIYEAKYGKVNPVDLTKQKVRFISEKMNMIDFEPSMEEKYSNHKYFHRLYETKEQAEWASKYQRISRTEYLDLPTWEEFKGSEKPIRFCGDDWEVYELGIRLNLNEIYLDLIEDYDTYTQRRYKATEENYIKACDLCIKLFKGGNK